MYIELLKQCLLDNIYGSVVIGPPSVHNIGQVATEEQTTNGTVWPSRAHTMIGKRD
jgi:hypothetical protein